MYIKRRHEYTYLNTLSSAIVLIHNVLYEDDFPIRGRYNDVITIRDRPIRIPKKTQEEEGRETCDSEYHIANDTSRNEGECTTKDYDKQ